MILKLDYYSTFSDFKRGRSREKYFLRIFHTIDYFDLVLNLREIGIYRGRMGKILEKRLEKNVSDIHFWTRKFEKGILVVKHKTFPETVTRMSLILNEDPEEFLSGLELSIQKSQLLFKEGAG